MKNRFHVMHKLVGEDGVKRVKILFSTNSKQTAQDWLDMGGEFVVLDEATSMLMMQPSDLDRALDKVPMAVRDWSQVAPSVFDIVEDFIDMVEELKKDDEGPQEAK